MSEDRTKKDPLLGGLDGMRAGQHWEGEPESLRHSEKPDQAQEAFSAEKVQSAEEEARKIAQELHREAVRTGNTEKEVEVPQVEPAEGGKKKSRKKEEQPGGWGKELFEWIKIVVSAALIAFVLNTFIIANSEVPSGSMENTIMTGDRVIGSRLSYHFEDPKRGDIAIFRFPDNEKIYYVKRIIGLPGETVDIVDGKVYINGSLLEESEGSVLSWNGTRCAPDESPAIDTYEDHRMAMAFAPAALCNSALHIRNPHVVSKSYPRFWEDLLTAGFRITQL